MELEVLGTFGQRWLTRSLGRTASRARDRRDGEDDHQTSGRLHAERDRSERASVPGGSGRFDEQARREGEAENVTARPVYPAAAMTTLGLIPGACHGAWCWKRLVPELEARGHRPVAVDLPCEDPSAGFERYVEATFEALPNADDDPVLVGHSLGAHTAARAARERTIRGIVFLCGIIPPRAGERTGDEPPLEAPGAFEGLERDELGRVWFPNSEDAIRDFFPDCDEETAAWAASMLRRQSTTPHQRLSDPVSPPPCPSVSIVCTDDRVATAEWGRWAAHERLLDAPVLEIGGSHSPFLSRPAELADAIGTALGNL
jgi:pimeloyl-ACP methyl ester carboxylesterase